MKLMCVLIAVLIFLFPLNGQEVKVPKEVKSPKDINIPKEVKSSFDKLYPNASEIKWGTEKHGEYKVGFEDDGKYVSVVFHKSGTIKEIKALLSPSELPKSIAQVIAKKYYGFYITAAYKISDNKGKLIFRTEIAKDKVKKELKFDHNGMLLSAKK